MSEIVSLRTELDRLIDSYRKPAEAAPAIHLWLHKVPPNMKGELVAYAETRLRVSA